MSILDNRVLSGVVGANFVRFFFSFLFFFDGVLPPATIFKVQVTRAFPLSDTEKFIFFSLRRSILLLFFP